MSQDSIIEIFQDQIMFEKVIWKLQSMISRSDDIAMAILLWL